jgi:FkbM family methyltransferase
MTPADRLRKALSTLMQFAGRGLLRTSQYVYLSPDAKWAKRSEQRARAWFADPRHESLRADYPLDSSSVVFDVGGFEGAWATDIFSRFACRIEVFEPVPQFAAKLEWKFAPNPRISVHAIALGASNRNAVIHVQGDVSSAQFTPARAVDTPVVVRDVASFVSAESAGIDLLKLNVEGDEYAVLERLLDAGLMARIGYLLVQFHDHVPDAERRLAGIVGRLGATHELMWRFPFIWESWERKPSPAERGADV